MIIYQVSVYDNFDPIRAFEFKFSTRIEASDFVKNVFLSAGFNVAVTITRMDEPRNAPVFDARTGERKEYDV